MMDEGDKQYSQYSFTTLVALIRTLHHCYLIDFQTREDQRGRFIPVAFYHCCITVYFFYVINNKISPSCSRRRIQKTAYIFSYSTSFMPTTLLYRDFFLYTLLAIIPIIIHLLLLLLLFFIYFFFIFLLIIFFHFCCVVIVMFMMMMNE